MTGTRIHGGSDSPTLPATLSPRPSDRQIAEAARLCGYTDAARYVSRASFLFQGVTLPGRRVLDIGCGRGSWALWAGLHGADAIGIEPEVEGSTPGSFAKFQHAIQTLGLGSSVRAVAADARTYTAPEPFDVIVLYNVINHFSETHTRTLERPESRQVYVQIFQQLARLLTAGGAIILADCSRRNLFPEVGLPNPIDRSIEWDIHRTPEEWTDVARAAGLRASDLRWSYLYPLTWLPMNRLLAYITTSHFVLRLTK